MSEIGVAVIGLGFVGGRAHAPSFRRIPGAKLIAVSDLIKETAQTLVDKYGCKYYNNHLDAIKDPEVDAVVVAVPTPYHYQIAKDAITHGKHVLCEMPLTTTEEQAKELLSEKALGRPLSFTFTEFIPAKELAQQWPLTSWAWDIEKSGGYPDYTLSVWSIDLIQWLFDTEVDEIHWQSVYSPIEGIEDSKGYQTVGSAKLKNGMVGTFQLGSTVAEGLGTSLLQIFGNNTKTLRAIWNDKLEILGKDEERRDWSFKVKGPRVWGHLQTDQYFIECILEGKKPEFGVDDALRIQRIAKKIVK